MDRLRRRRAETVVLANADWNTSPIGVDEGAAPNNHGTWYDAQTLRYAVFVGRFDVACKIIQAAPYRRVAAQIKPDGTMPLELARADPFHYELYDLRRS